MGFPRNRPPNLPKMTGPSVPCDNHCLNNQANLRIDPRMPSLHECHVPLDVLILVPGRGTLVAPLPLPQLGRPKSGHTQPSHQLQLPTAGSLDFLLYWPQGPWQSHYPRRVTSRAPFYLCLDPPFCFCQPQKDLTTSKHVANTISI